MEEHGLLEKVVRPAFPSHMADMEEDSDDEFQCGSPLLVAVSCVFLASGLTLVIVFFMIRSSEVVDEDVSLGFPRGGRGGGGVGGGGGGGGGESGGGGVSGGDGDDQSIIVPSVPEIPLLTQIVPTHAHVPHNQGPSAQPASDLSPQPVSAPQPAPGPIIQPAPGPSLQPAPGPSLQPAPGPSPQPAPSPGLQPTPGPDSQPTPASRPQTAPGPRPQPVSGPSPGPQPSPSPQPAPRPSLQPAPVPGPQTNPDPAPQPSPRPRPQPAPGPIPQTAPGPSPRPVPGPSAQPAPSPGTQPTQGPVVILTSPPAPRTSPVSTTPPPPLLCSVSETATQAAFYPDDNLCDIIMYTHVLVVHNEILPVDDSQGYMAFTNICAYRYRMTTCGISFDARYVQGHKFTDEVSREIVNLAQMNIVHLGILNMYDSPTRVLLYASDVEASLQKMTTLKGPTSKVIYGMGFSYYNETKAWQHLEVLVLATTAVDIIVIITCVSTVPESIDCTAMPPTATWSYSTLPPTFEKALPMARNSFNAPSEVIAFAFQMGTLVYNMTDSYRSISEAVYKKCRGFMLGDNSHTCQGIEGLLVPEVALARTTAVDQGTLFYIYDTEATMREKAEYVMTAKDRRDKFTWFLFNVHLTDVPAQCHHEGSFKRLEKFRKFYYDMS